MMCLQCKDDLLLKGALLSDVFSNGNIWLCHAVCSVSCFGIRQRTVNYCKLANSVSVCDYMHVFPSLSVFLFKMLGSWFIVNLFKGLIKDNS